MGRAVDKVLATDEPKSSTQRVREYRARKKAAAEAPEEQITVTPGDVAVAGAVGDALWSIAGPMFRLRPLDDAQRERLGEALAPLVVKYMPLLGKWQYEAAALLCIMSLAKECYVPKGATDDAGQVREAEGSPEASPDGASTHGD